MDRALSQLSRAISAHDHSLVLQHANEIISLSSPNPHNLAIECKTVALLHLGEFEQAVQSAKAIGGFLYAYALYRVKKNDLAKEAVDGITDQKNDSVLHLKAQIDYRLEEFKSCVDVYANQVSDAKSEDVVANLMACYIMSGNTREAIQLASKTVNLSSASYDFLYNYALALADDGKLNDALVKIEESLDRGRKTLEENNYSKEEVEKELESVYTTKAYILQLLGKTEDSIEIYSKVLDSEPNNLSHSIASAANNIVTLTYTKENFFESSKRLLRATKVPDDLLSPRQKKFILFNQALLAYHGKQNQRCQTLLKEIQQKYPNEDFPKLVLAAIHYRERQYAKSDSTLSSLNSFTGIVSRAAITITTGNNNQAIEILESQNMVRFDPAVVSILAQLYEKQGNSAAALKAYDDAIQFHSKAKNVDQLRTLRMKSATFKYHKNMFPECVSDFENLYSLDHKGFQNMPFDALSCMVIASSKVKSNIASKYAGELPPIPGIESISLEELEQKITVPLEILRKRGKAKEEKEDTDAEKKVAKKKKNRKKRFPKNFDPEKPGPMPDPERWLPRWQRSSSKKKMSKKARESMVFKGAQGAGDSGNIHSRSSSGSISLPQSDAAPVESSKSSSSSKRSAKSSKKKGGRR